MRLDSCIANSKIEEPKSKKENFTLPTNRGNVIICKVIKKWQTPVSKFTPLPFRFNPPI